MGRDPCAIEELRLVIRKAVPTPTEVVSAIEQALWDLAGKAAGNPIYRLLGAHELKPVPLYANINRATVDRTPPGFAANAVAAASEGFRAIKLAPFDEVRRDQEDSALKVEHAAMGIARVREVCDAVRPHAEVYVDCHQRFDFGAALEVARALHDLGVTWFEQPLDETVPEQLVRLCELSPIPLAGGENLRSLHTARALIAHRPYPIFMPDVKRIGGILEMKEAADVAAKHGMTTAPHCPSGPISVAASAHSMLAMEDCRVLEFPWGEIPWRKELIRPAEQVLNGNLILSDRPGLGAELNRELVERLVDGGA